MDLPTTKHLPTTDNKTLEPIPRIQIKSDGSISCGDKTYLSGHETIRKNIIKLIAENAYGRLLKSDYRSKLISQHVNPASKSIGIISSPYLRRQNNVDKALSRLRQDLQRQFGNLMPEGTAWLCFSKKIDGWLLYRLPGLGCDGEYHW